jgi:GTPase SAR1 family protein
MRCFPETVTDCLDSGFGTSMTEQHSLRQEMESFFDFALQECRALPELRELGAVIQAQQNAIRLPMRVAFVGKTNCGKSTMMNAFLGEEVAPTGNGELTFNVSWFRYGGEKKLLVHTIQGGIEEETFESISELTSRCEQKRDLLERIRYIEVQCPNPLLKIFDLIDTPGLHSFYEKDSRNTQQLLTDQETRPHAVVFMFSGSLQEPDVIELEQFHKNCGSLMSGLTAIGALTKVDESENGIADGERSIRQLQERHPRTHHIFTRSCQPWGRRVMEPRRSLTMSGIPCALSWACQRRDALN